MIYWDRITLKSRAKAVLKNSYWMTLLALFIASFLGSESGNSSQYISVSFSASSIIPTFRTFGTFPYDWALGVLVFTSLAITLFAVGYGLFIGNIIYVGKCRYLTMCRYGKTDIGELFFSFKRGIYMNTVKTMFFRSLYIFLWSLLLVIPGIIKTYEYKMVPYILAENPWISKDRAFEISKNTTYGEKWNMFVLDLSFIGWILLGMLACCGIGVFFLNPYIEATQAELYGALRYKAVANRLCSPDEIGRELFV